MLNLAGFTADGAAVLALAIRGFPRGGRPFGIRTIIAAGMELAPCARRGASYSHAYRDFGPARPRHDLRELCARHPTNARTDSRSGTRDGGSHGSLGAYRIRHQPRPA